MTTQSKRSTLVVKVVPRNRGHLQLGDRIAIAAADQRVAVPLISALCQSHGPIAATRLGLKALKGAITRITVGLNPALLQRPQLRKEQGKNTGVGWKGEQYFLFALGGARYLHQGPSLQAYGRQVHSWLIAEGLGG